MGIPPERIRQFRKMILSWWKANKRDLPWRHTRDPYRILVSEVMLQQTQVQRVLSKYAEFIQVYPSVHSLAQASPADVLRLWKGMGYNRRALYLKKAAETVVGEYGGAFPKEEQLLTKLPGLGRYTARAILVFAYGKDVAMVDTNIRQIITHFFFNGMTQKEKTIQKVADILVPRGKSWEWHQALMDFGALALKKTKSPRKTAMPFKDSDRYYRGRIVDALRLGPSDVATLIDSLVRHYNKPPEFFARIISGLEKDGLLTMSASGLRLPE